MAIDPSNSPPPSGFQNLEQVEKQIADTRAKESSMLRDAFVDQMDLLYREKARLLRSKPTTEQPDSLRAFEPALPDQQAKVAQQQPQEQAGEVSFTPEQQCANRQVDETLQAEWGLGFQQNAELIEREALQLFNNDRDKLLDFIVANDLDIDAEARIETARFLLKLAKRRQR